MGVAARVLPKAEPSWAPAWPVPATEEGVLGVALPGILAEGMPEPGEAGQGAPLFLGPPAPPVRALENQTKDPGGPAGRGHRQEMGF